jgi:alpha-glucosidase
MSEMKWWQTAVFYQIYPRSFADGNGDGIGDVAGMIAKLDYLKDLGVDGIWLSPHFPSPMCDCGYDVSDYQNVAPEYGTLDEFQRFIEEAHQRGIRVILDLVLNHTSDQHPWFIESRSSRDNPKRDWYIWKDGKNGQLPTNWFSTFGGSAWEFDPQTDAYYYHYFFAGQPDLNYHNPLVVEAMWETVRWWLRRGVDGFRLDAVGTIFEDETYPDQTSGITLDELQMLARQAKTKAEHEHVNEMFKLMFGHQVDKPGVHDLMRGLRQVMDEFPDRVLVGETDDIAFYGDGNNELHLNFNFPLMRTDRITPAWVRQNQDLRLSVLPAGAWPCNTLGNHDTDRLFSRYGDGQHDAEIARLNLALMLTLKGTPFLYNGEEIGMTDLIIPDLSLLRDPLSTVLHYPVELQMGMSEPEAALSASKHGRDKCRTPLQWDNLPNGGFCPPQITPWLPVNPNYAEGVNVAEQSQNPDSLLNFYRTMLRVHKYTPALRQGDYQPLLENDPNVLAFIRFTAQQKVLVAMNYSAEAQCVALELPGLHIERIHSSHPRHSADDRCSQFPLSPFEVFIGKLD